MIKSSIEGENKKTECGHVHFRTIGNRKVFVLIRVNNVMNLGSENEQPDLSDEPSNHYTVLNLEKLNGSIVVRFSDSAINDTNMIPETIKLLLSRCGIHVQVAQKYFSTAVQGNDADSGYYAVFHALRILGLSTPQPSIEEFMKHQRI